MNAPRVLVSATEYAALKKAAAERAAERAEDVAETEGERAPELGKAERFARVVEPQQQAAEANAERRRALEPPSTARDGDDEEDDVGDPMNDPMLQFLAPRQRAPAAAFMVTLSSAPKNCRMGDDGIVRKNFGRGPSLGHIILLLDKHFGRGAAAASKRKPSASRSRNAAAAADQSAALKDAPFWWDAGGDAGADPEGT